MPKLKTYLVEDSPVIRENLIATLEELAPVEVVGTADSESSAIGWLGAHAGQYDLVIIDIFLKGGSGLGVLASPLLRSNGAKVVILSNYATADMRRKCLELGADRVFDKSNEIDSLVSYCADGASGISS
jgi:DNA-binding NarL/FixJ family response regulator